MSIINSIRNILMGMGTSFRGGAVSPTVATGSSSITATIGPLTLPISCGYWRVKLKGLGAATVGDINVTGTDGVAACLLGNFSYPTALASPNAEISGMFQSDQALTSFTFTASLGGTTPAGTTADFEVWGQAG